MGKSVLTLQVVDPPHRTAFSLDDPLTLDFAASNPAQFLLAGGSGTLVIDEIQRVPSLILPLKAQVDRSREPGRFLLTGSADLLATRGVGDSMAEWAETIRLYPLSQGGNPTTRNPGRLRVSAIE